jgi:inner membrane protein YidH
MIRNFSDHAANERTFLAWVRTAIAVMAFGFLVARFNLFLRIAAQSLGAEGGRTIALRGGDFGGAAGLVLILAGTVIVIVSALRFIRTGRAIDSPDQHIGGARADLVLAALMVILGIAMVVYLSQTLSGGL